MSTVKTRTGEIVQDPPFARLLFGDTRSKWLWLIPRVWLGYQWLQAGFHKLEDAAWMQTGEALKGFWERAVLIPESGRPAISFDWYRSFLQALLDAQTYTWFAKVVSVGETLVGIALIVGAFTGFAAFFGAFMNFNFMLAGSASTNPVLFLFAIGLIMAWKVAGLLGADALLLPLIGTPWRGMTVGNSPQTAEAGT
ncbi:MAG: DoxX family protein [Anaerolineales bacterium]